ncbi:MAG: aldehyde dehydrogenase family protein [Bryobacterales bacterium]|nr:aldehyde dehydrogenase family protein [Bryobacterales bacterium]
MLHDTDLVSIQEVRAKVEKAYAAFQHLRRFNQEQLDRIVEAMGAAARGAAVRLAEMAVEETSYGNVKDKTAKNLLNADLLVRSIRGMKTSGVLREIPEKKLVEIGVPVGVIAAILPTTNPTSSAIYKAIIALKAGNTVVISPHPRAKNCTCATADLLYQAAREAGAPEDVIQCIANATMEGTDALMRHPRTSVILATGGAGIVRAAYSSGKPAFGVGPGNVPVLLEESADIATSVAKVVEGKSFDYGTVCSSEQTLVAAAKYRDQVWNALKAQKAYVCTDDQAKALAKLLIAPNWRINPNCVGQSPQKIAQMAGFAVPDDARILAVEIKGVGKEHPLSMEKLSPVLSVLFANCWDEQIKMCQATLKFGGLGHTCVIHSRDDAKIREYGIRMPAFRVLVNTPSPQGSTGITTGVQPSMTLGCGAMAGNSTSDNVGPQHLINTKRIAYVIRTPEEAFPGDSGDVKQMIGSAVERFLEQRGFGVKPVAGVAAAAPAAPVFRPAAAGNTSDIVDRFLRAKGRMTNVAAAPGCAASCPCAATGAPACAATAPAAPPGPPPAAKAEPAAAVPVVDFVCEADVRSAALNGRKIFIGPKTIVTPAAREVANQHDVLVVAQR